jgi:hypothetical protein
MSYIDTEWAIAEKTGPVKTWWVDTGTGKFVKMYTEALAKLVSERTGWKITPFS